MLVWQRNPNAVGGVVVYQGGVMHGDGVGLLDNTGQRVSRLYQRHRVYLHNGYGV